MRFGAIVKVQPGLILGWAILTRRWGAVAAGAVVLVVIALGAAVLPGGLAIWVDYQVLLRNVGDPIRTPTTSRPARSRSRWAWRTSWPR